MIYSLTGSLQHTEKLGAPGEEEEEEEEFTVL